MCQEGKRNVSLNMVEQADGRERGQHAYNGRQDNEPQVMLGDNTIQHSVHAVLIADQSSLLRCVSAYVRALKNAVDGPQEFESKFHKNAVKDANSRQ